MGICVTEKRASVRFKKPEATLRASTNEIATNTKPLYSKFLFFMLIQQAIMKPVYKANFQDCANTLLKTISGYLLTIRIFV